MAQLKDRYAAALFELSLQQHALPEHMKQAQFVCDTLQQQHCESFLLHPHIPDSAKHKLLQSLFAGTVSADIMGFLYLAVDKNREALMVPALTAFIEQGNRHSGIVQANVVSAAPLSSQQIDSLRALLCKKLAKQVQIQTRVDPALLGGFYIQAQGHLIDRTVRTQLIAIKDSLIRGGAL